MQQTLARPVSVAGPGLHTGRPCRLTLHPAPPDHGRRVVHRGDLRAAAEMTWRNCVPSPMSTSIALGAGRTVRTVEHLMASLWALDVDNVLVEVDGPEVPILDGSAHPWCRHLLSAGLVGQGARRRAIRLLAPVQVRRQGGFLRAEPADGGFSADVTFDLLPGRRLQRWAGVLDRSVFLNQLQRSRSFGAFDWRRALGLPARGPRSGRSALTGANQPDPALSAARNARFEHRLVLARERLNGDAPALRGAGLGRATLVVGGWLLPYPRYRDEPLRHVVLDMLGDLALAGAPLLGRIVAHNPSHEKTHLLVAALMQNRLAWRYTRDDEAEPAGPPPVTGAR